MTSARAMRGGSVMRAAGGPFRLAGIAICLLLSLASQVLAQGLSSSGQPAFPALSGRIVDGAGIIPQDRRAAIDGKLAAHEAKTTDQIVIATLPSLQGYAVEDFANRLFRAWRLGQDKTNNGVLLLVAPTERKVRIEVGYGLEGALTDALSRVVIATAITPRFKTGDFAGGIEAGVDAILSILSKDADEWQRRAKVRDDQPGFEAVIPFLIMALFLAIFLTMAFNSVRQGRSGSRWHRTRKGGWVMLPGTGTNWGGSGSSGSGWGGGGGWSGGGGFSGGGGSSGGGGASGDW
jgi:uncharacterized protein